MKKSFYLLVLNFALCMMHSALVSAQAGMWTWISGSSAPNAGGVYGTQGIPSINNHPPAMYEACEWKDKQGNFWVYSGFGYFDDDLWKFNPATLEWTWMKGSGLPNVDPVYGTQGVPAPTNSPGQRYFGAGTWVDTTGNLWLFGGLPYRNDLWKYNIGTNEWTWMKGDTAQNSFGSHGVQGVPGPANVPGSRYESSTQWTDSLNNLWLFGGGGYGDFGGPGYLNDLMKYDISTNEWTWMKGSNALNPPANYGIKGVSSPANDPGGRWTYTKFKDPDGDFWLCGGYDGACFGDWWKYDADINEWTWMAGNTIGGQAGSYNNYCSFDSISDPGARAEQRSSVTGRCGTFWSFGGRSSTNSPYSDLWIFNSATLQWSWMSGTSLAYQPGNYGTLGVPSITNLPTARVGSLAWWGNDDRFYMYGGWNMSGSFYCDMWVFTPDAACTIPCGIIPVAAFSAPNHICPGTCTDFNNISVNATSFIWIFPGGAPASSTDVNPANICYNTAGTYDVTLIASGPGGMDTLTLSNYITVFPQPSPQGITQSGDTLFALPGAVSYQWYFNGSQIAGGTNYFYVASISGDYNVVATDDNGCEVEAVIYNVLAGLPSTVDRGRLTIFPNPVTDELIIKNEVPMGIGIKIEAAGIAIYNVVGQEVLRIVDCKLPTVDCRLLSPGIYVIEIISDSKAYRSRFVKQ